MSPHEARMALDFLPDFKMGLASDGAGNYVQVPMTAYQHTPTFRQRWPRMYKAIAIAAAVLTLGVSVSGCIVGNNSGGVRKEISNVSYDDGRDGVRNTTDDGVLFQLAKDGKWYRIGTDIGENLTYINNTLQLGGGIDFVAADRGDGAPGHVLRINEISSPLNYQRYEEERDAENTRVIILGGTYVALAFAVVSGLFCLDKLMNRLKK